MTAVRVVVLAAALVGLALAGCRAVSTVPSGPTVDLTVLGAASLRDALEAARSVYQAETPGTSLTLGFDASSTLRAQIEQGAPGDLFLAADTRDPDALAAEGLTVGTPVPFATNTIVIVTPPDDPAGILDPFDLARPGVRIVVAGPEVPISVYGDRVLEALAGLPGAPEGFLDAVAENVVSREDNVRAVAAKIELGEGDAALVYATDARAADLRVVPLPEEAQVIAVYSGAILAGSAQPSAARALLDWLAGPRGRAVLATSGFGPAP